MPKAGYLRKKGAGKYLAQILKENKLKAAEGENDFFDACIEQKPSDSGGTFYEG